jgi:N6-adenosine-specific RNA methylase IME4
MLELDDLEQSDLQWGMSYTTRANPEIMLLATRGAPMRLAAVVHQVVIAPHPGPGRHSEKPEEVRRRIERLYPGPYLELFGRKTVPGWTVWGNEIERGLMVSSDDEVRP